MLLNWRFADTSSLLLFSGNITFQPFIIYPHFTCRSSTVSLAISLTAHFFKINHDNCCNAEKFQNYYKKSEIYTNITISGKTLSRSSKFSLFLVLLSSKTWNGTLTVPTIFLISITFINRCHNWHFLCQHSPIPVLVLAWPGVCIFIFIVKYIHKQKRKNNFMPFICLKPFNLLKTEINQITKIFL